MRSMALGLLVAAFSAVWTSAPAQSKPPKVYPPKFGTFAVGLHFSCALKYDGQAFCWGANYYGQLGVKEAPGLESCARGGGLVSACATLPIPVGTTQRFYDIDVGLKHVCGVSMAREVWCWGRNEAGELGSATSTTCAPGSLPMDGGEFATMPCSFEPLRVAGLPPVHSVAVGDDFSCALTENDGVVFCWGGSAGPLPRRLSDDVRFLRMSAGYSNLCADSFDGRVACWSLYGGVSPAKWMTLPGGLNRVETHSHSCAIGAENRAYCWGYDASGALGLGKHQGRVSIDTPAVVAGDRRFTNPAVSFLGTCALQTSGGELYCWGSPPSTPQPDRCFSGGEFGGYHACAVSPQAVFHPRNFSRVSISTLHGCARSATETIYCWGANSFGELGNGTTDASYDEQQVVGLQGKRSLRSRLSWPSTRFLVPFGLFVLLAGALAFIFRRRPPATPTS
jgi:alpha-tubulin suppressor-like RCC1 family protein